MQPNEELTAQEIEKGCLIPVITTEGVGYQIPDGTKVRLLSYGLAPWGTEFCFFEVTQ